MAETQCIGIIVNPEKAGAKELLLDLVDRFRDAGMETVVERESAGLACLEGGVSLDEMSEAADVLLVLGGDGTILYTVRQVGEKVKPLAGINTGTLGFLTCATADERGDLVEALASGDYQITDRMMIRCRVTHQDEEPQSFAALNEVTVGRGMNSRSVHVETRVDGFNANRYSGDGLIVATPTGSTAYSLSAGGPLVTPGARAFLLTPICPHTLANRPLVVAGTSTVTLHVPNQRDALSLSVDGRAALEMSGEATIEIVAADYSLPLISLPGQNFYGVLHQKLGWTGSSVR